jgi:DNA mismatch repair ATPase MutS
MLFVASPSASLEEINERLDLVSEVLTSSSLREEIVILLRRTFDSWRLLQKFAFGSGVPDDLVSLASTVQATVQLSRILRDHIQTPVDEAFSASNATRSAVGRLVQRLELDSVTALSQKIIAAIDEDKLSEQHSIEDAEAVATVQMAEKVLKDAGEPGELQGIPQRVRKKLSSDVRERAEPSEDIWIMRPRYYARLIYIILVNRIKRQ